MQKRDALNLVILLTMYFLLRETEHLLITKQLLLIENYEDIPSTHLITKPYRRMGGGGITPHILNFGTTWESSGSQPSRFTHGTHFIIGWVNPKTGVDEMVKRKKLLLRRESNPARPFRKPVTILTELLSSK
jgi:hypothetical protein